MTGIAFLAASVSFFWTALPRSATAALYVFWSFIIFFCSSDFFLRLVEREPSTADVYSGIAVTASSTRS